MSLNVFTVDHYLIVFMTMRLSSGISFILLSVYKPCATESACSATASEEGVTYSSTSKICLSHVRLLQRAAIG